MIPPRRQSSLAALWLVLDSIETREPQNRGWNEHIIIIASIGGSGERSEPGCDLHATCYYQEDTSLKPWERLKLWRKSIIMRARLACEKILNLNKHLYDRYLLWKSSVCNTYITTSTALAAAAVGWWRLLENFWEKEWWLLLDPTNEAAQS